MQNILTFCITFIAFTAIALLISYCRRRLRKTPHGLTGMCHKDGGTMCSSCQDQIKEVDKMPPGKNSTMGDKR